MAGGDGAYQLRRNAAEEGEGAAESARERAGGGVDRLEDEGRRVGADGVARASLVQSSEPRRVREYGARSFRGGVQRDGPRRLSRGSGVARLRAHWLGAHPLAIQRGEVPLSCRDDPGGSVSGSR